MIVFLCSGQWQRCAALSEAHVVGLKTREHVGRGKYASKRAAIRPRGIHVERHARYFHAAMRKQTVLSSRVIPTIEFVAHYSNEFATNTPNQILNCPAIC